jgi:hypothetical protein
MKSTGSVQLSTRHDSFFHRNPAICESVTLYELKKREAIAAGVSKHGYGDGLEITTNRQTVGVVPARVQVPSPAPLNTPSVHTISKSLTMPFHELQNCLLKSLAENLVRRARFELAIRAF